MNYNAQSKLTAATQRALNEQRREREAQEEAARQEQAERDRENARVRAAYRAGLEAKKAAKQAERDAELEAELTPERARLERQWRADHPDQDGRDFQRKAWPALRANLIEARETAQREALRRELLASGRYSL